MTRRTRQGQGGDVGAHGPGERYGTRRGRLGRRRPNSSRTGPRRRRQLPRSGRDPSEDDRSRQTDIERTQERQQGSVETATAGAGGRRGRLRGAAIRLVRAQQLKPRSSAPARAAPRRDRHLAAMRRPGGRGTTRSPGRQPRRGSRAPRTGGLRRRRPRSRLRQRSRAWRLRG